MNKNLIIVVSVILAFLFIRSCGSERRIERKAITGMKALLEGTWYVADDGDMDEVEDILKELGAPKFKRGQHAIGLVRDIYGVKQGYIVWVQDGEVLYYRMTGEVNAGRIEKVIYPNLYEKGWRK